MNKQPTNPRALDKTTPPWRETPLDHWSKDIDPVMMSGDEWVVGHRDPGAQRIAEEQGGTVMGERFMHPMHDTNYGLEEDAMMASDKDDPEGV